MDFRLADMPEAGSFFLTSSSWDLAESLTCLAGALDGVSGAALCQLRLELVEFATLSGTQVSYRRPVVEVGGRAVAGLGGFVLAA